MTMNSTTTILPTEKTSEWVNCKKNSKRALTDVYTICKSTETDFFTSNSLCWEKMKDFSK